MNLEKKNSKKEKTERKDSTPRGSFTFIDFKSHSVTDCESSLGTNTVHLLSSNSKVTISEKSSGFPQHLNSHTLSLCLPWALSTLYLKLYSLKKDQDKGDTNHKSYPENRCLYWHPTIWDTKTPWKRFGSLRALVMDRDFQECSLLFLCSFPSSIYFKQWTSLFNL